MNSDFQTWLLAQNYLPSTARRLAQEVSRVERELGAGAKLDTLGCKSALGHYLQFAAERELDGEFVRQLSAAGLQPLESKPLARRSKLMKVSFDDSDWANIARALEKDPRPEGRILYAMAHCGFRIGETIALSIEQIDDALETNVLKFVRKGGHLVEVPIDEVREPWQRIADAFSRRFTTLAEWITSTAGASPLAGDAAYRRMDRYLKNVAKRAGAKGRVHLHRMRRTVAMQALRVTKDEGAVQNLLDHASIDSTHEYTNERRPQEIRKLHRKLGKFREGLEG